MPRTLAENAQYIAETIKPAIKSAIEAQGVTVPSTDSFLDYADRIAEIEGGGSGYQLKDLPTGSISTVNDAAELPLNALKVSVEAVQDLHGYDHPWVGGAGKNLLPPINFSEQTIDGMTYKTDGQGTYFINGINGVTQTRIDVPITPITLPPTIYCHLKNPTVNSHTVIAFLDENNVQLTYLSGTVANRIYNFSTDLGGKTIAKITISVYGNGAEVTNFQMSPMLMVTDTPSDFFPYSNVCPISGWDSGEITVCDDIQSPTQTETTSLDFPTTIYGAEWDVVNGELGLKITDGFYSSYNGETLPDVWMSDRDVYQEGTTPTIGAEVKYKLATPIYVTLTGLSIRLLEGTNNLYADCGEVIEGEYFVDEGAIDVRKVDYTIGNNTALKISDGRILQGFVNMNNYGIFPRDASNNWLDVDWSKDFEIGVAFKFTALPTSNYAMLFGAGTSGGTNYRNTPRLYYDASASKLSLNVFTASGDLTPTIDYTLSANTWYHVILKFTASTLAVEVKISTDFNTYTTIYSATASAVPIHNTAMLIFGGDANGANFSSNNLLIDTFNTYIKGDGVNWGAFTGAFPS